MKKVTHLMRWFDFSLPSNRLLFFASPLIGAAALAWELRLVPFTTALAAGFNAAAAAGLGWVLGRELDPDRPATAGAALVLGGVASLWIGPVALGGLYLLAITARVLVRTTGLPPTVADLAVNLVVAAAFAGTTAGWACGLVFAFALARDAGLPDPPARSQLLWSLTTAAAVTVVATWREAVTFSVPPAGAAAIAVLGLAAGVTLPDQTPISVGDLTDFPLDRRRLRSGRRTVVAALVLAGVVGGGNGVVPLAAGWLAVMATAVATRIGRGRPA